MTQRVILSNFIKYIQFKKPIELAKIQDAARRAELENYFNELEERLKQGNCFGFSVVRTAMKKMGYLSWWKDVLIKIANWDGDPKKLNEEYVFEEQGNGWRKFFKKIMNGCRNIFSKKKITLEDVIEKAMHYVVFHQSSKKYLRKSSQGNLLHSPYFELIDKDNKIKHIVDHQMIVRHFSAERLANFLVLNKEAIQKSLCVLLNLDHALSFGYEDGKWVLYNPNFDHKSKKTIQKEFLSAVDLAKEIITIQGGALKLELASIDEPLFILDIDNPSPEFLRGHGLAMIAGHAPEKFAALLELADKTMKGQTIVAKALLEKDRDNEPAITVVARNKLEKVFDVALKSPFGFPNLIKALITISTRTNESGLEFIDSSFHENLFKKLNDACQSNLASVWKHFPILLKPNNEQEKKIYEAQIRAINLIVMKLIAAGANINSQDEKGNTILHLAAASNNESLVDDLLACGANVNAIDARKNSALHHAVVSNNYSMVKFLVQKGASLKLRDARGYTPLQLSLEMKNPVVSLEIKKLLMMNEYGLTRYHQFVASSRLKTCKNLLCNYTKGSRWARFFTLHWNRSHVSSVEKVLKNFSKYKNVEEVYQAIAADNPNKKMKETGSLYRRLFFSAGNDLQNLSEQISHSKVLFSN